MADDDPYIDPETGILANLTGARTQAELDRDEGELVFAAYVDLVDRQPIKPTGDLAELQAIHRHLFRDVYPWAGRLRRVDIRKNVPGAEPFMPVSRIASGAGYAFEELRAERFLRGLSRDSFVARLAHHYDQVNYLHPFREGNGRTQRTLWTRVARDAGWQLDWRSVTGAVNDRVSRAAAEQGDFGPLRDMLDSITSPAAPASGRDATWRRAELLRAAFPTSARESLSRPPSETEKQPQRRPRDLGLGRDGGVER